MMAKIQGEATARMTQREQEKIRRRRPKRRKLWQDWWGWLLVAAILFVIVPDLYHLWQKYHVLVEVTVSEPGKPEPLRALDHRGAKWQVLGIQLDGAIRVGCIAGVSSIIQCLQTVDHTSNQLRSVKCEAPLVEPIEAALLTLHCERPTP